MSTRSQSHPKRISESDTTTESHERTNERTKMSEQLLRITQEGRRASNDRMATLGEVIEAGILPDGTRHPITRTGPRAPIPHWVRTAVWYRDSGACELCANKIRLAQWELDHITPWSAGGSDDSTNLRVLCVPHNQARGNQVDPSERPRQPVTWWCVNCYQRGSRSWRYDRGPIPICPRHTVSGWSFGDTIPKRCNVMRMYEHTLSVYGERSAWHERDPMVELHTVAFCAHCGRPNLTDRPL